MHALDLDYAGRAVWSHIMLVLCCVFKFKPPSSVVKENAAKLWKCFVELQLTFMSFSHVITGGCVQHRTMPQLWATLHCLSAGQQAEGASEMTATQSTWRGSKSLTKCLGSARKRLRREPDARELWTNHLWGPDRSSTLGPTLKSYVWASRTLVKPLKVQLTRH